MVKMINEVYKCEKCGNIVEVKNVGGGTLVCCGENMKLLVENTTDAAKEKHVPVIEKIDGGYKVKVGEVAHPMIDTHYIQFIELITESGILTKYLKPGEEAVAVFKTDAAKVSAREFCNLHGLWKS